MNIPKEAQLEAGYRVALKRITRNAVGTVDNEAKTKDLEIIVRNLARHAPAVIARSLSRIFKDSALAWERGNNSGNAACLERMEWECEKLRDRAERVLKLWNVETDYPGLYPSFKWCEAHYYDCESLMRAIAS